MLPIPVIHVNFDKTSGRHYFYYYAAPTIDGTVADETLVRMEAKDSDYRKTLDANYKIYEERTCTYMFRGGQEGGSGNLSSAYIYLMPDGSVVSLSGTSNNRTYSAKGSWEEDKANHVITMDVNGTACTTDAYCDIAGKEGYRMQYAAASSGPGGGSSSMTLYASCDPSQFTWDQYTSTDFEGEDIFVMESADYELRLTEQGLCPRSQRRYLYSCLFRHIYDGCRRQLRDHHAVRHVYVRKERGRRSRWSCISPSRRAAVRSCRRQKR